MNIQSLLSSKPALGYGLGCGLLFGPIALTFVLVSTLTDIDRSTWIALHNVQGVFLVLLCLASGFAAARRSKSWAASVLAGTITGFMAVFLSAAIQGMVAYGLVDFLRQYPFEHHDYLSSGASTLKAYLFSSKGVYHYTWTAGVGLLFGLIFGAVVGGTGGLIQRSHRLVSRFQLSLS